jgi:hypothetical protein
VRDSHELAAEIDYDDPEELAALADARARGWCTSCLAGIGSVFVRAPILYELTPLGRATLEGQ